jgi:competence protein ComEC
MRRFRRVRIAAAAAAAGALVFALHEYAVRAPYRAADGEIGVYSATAAGYSRYERYTMFVDADITVNGRRLRASLAVRGDDAELVPGDAFTVYAELSYASPRLSAFSPKSVEPAGHRDSARYLPAVAARKMSESAERSFGARYAPLIKALTVGDADDLRADASAYRELSRAGTVHLAAVSGMHISFLVSMLSILIRNKRVLGAVLIPVLLFFAALCGFSAGVSRAVIMQIILLAAPLLRRDTDGVTGVSAALFLILLVNPYAAATKSLQLSFAATLGIVLFSRGINSSLTARFGTSRLAKVKPVRAAAAFVAAGFASSLGAVAFTTPLTAYYFGFVSVVSPLANVVSLWAAPTAFCLGLVAELFGILSPAAGLAAAKIAELPAAFLLGTARAFSQFPYAALYVSGAYALAWLVYVYASVVSLAALRAKLKHALVSTAAVAVTLVLAVSLTAAARTGVLEVTAIDVGQGQCIALRSGGETAIIDCGSMTADAGARAAAYLDARFERRIEFLVLSHFDSDHINGAETLLRNYRVLELYIPRPELGEDSTAAADEIITLAILRGTDIIYVDETTTRPLGSASVTLFAPYDAADAENDACVAVLAARGDFECLITGDLGFAGEMYLTELYALPDIEVLIAGHHGSRYSSGDVLLDAVTPELAIISVGRNSYGHPAAETLARFDERGITYRTTLGDGDVTADSNFRIKING